MLNGKTQCRSESALKVTRARSALRAHEHIEWNGPLIGNGCRFLHTPWTWSWLNRIVITGQQLPLMALACCRCAPWRQIVPTNKTVTTNQNIEPTVLWMALRSVHSSAPIETNPGTCSTHPYYGQNDLNLCTFQRVCATSTYRACNNAVANGLNNFRLTKLHAHYTLNNFNMIHTHTY